MNFLLYVLRALWAFLPMRRSPTPATITAARLAADLNGAHHRPSSAGLDDPNDFWDADTPVTCTDGSSTTLGHLADLADLLIANERKAHNGDPHLYHLASGRGISECPYCQNPMPPAEELGS